MASANYSNLPLHIANAAINFGTATFKCMLHTSVPSEANLDAWVNRSDVTNEVATGGGYTAGGVTVTATVSAVDTTNNRVAITFTDLTPGWNGTITAAAASIYMSTGTAATDKLISMVDFGGNVTSTSANYDITFTTPMYINR